MSNSRRKHSFEVRWRAFTMWQHLGFIPWEKPREKAIVKKKRSGDFYRGAFNSIPFLNDDAKRTFMHLLFRPGYMIRDYIRGEHERYLAPLTALIVFYAFFALVSAVLQPIQHKDDLSELTKEFSADSSLEFSLNLRRGSRHIAIGSGQDSIHSSRVMGNVVKIVMQGYLYLHLDQHPEAVDTQRKAAIAALETTLRGQGIPLFIGEFIFLWIAMMLALRRFRISRSACAAASAYVLCQFSFFMLFAVLLTWGKSTSIGIFLMLALLMLDYRQWLGLSWKKSFRRTLSTGIWYGLAYGAMLLLVSALVLVVAFFKTRA